jgi:hypothetical protein
MGKRCGQLAAALVGSLAAIALVPSPSPAQTAGVPPLPIPTDPLATGVDEFTGSAATHHRVHAPAVPRHPFMAPNGLSNIHDDAYQTDTYRHPGPLGVDPVTDSALFARECASITFDSQGRLVTICVGLDRPVLALLDPDTLEPLATFPLPPRSVGGGNPFTDFSGGGYFYLDQRDGVVAPTTTRHVLVIAETQEPGFEVRHDYDLTGAVADGDKIISALPDWRGGSGSPRWTGWSATSAGTAATCIPGRSASPSATPSRSTSSAASTSSATPPFIACALARETYAPSGGTATPTRAASNRVRPRPGPEPPRHCLRAGATWRSPTTPIPCTSSCSSAPAGHMDGGWSAARRCSSRGPRRPISR